MSRFGAFYSRSFAQRPWLTLAVTNGSLSVVADALAQTFEMSRSQRDAGVGEMSSFDFSRSARFLAFGSAMAPLLAEWNKFIELKFPLRSGPSASTASGHSKSASGLPLNSHEMGKLGSPKGKAHTSAGAAAARNLGKVSFLALGKRVVVDQGTFAPFGLALFVGFMGFMEGRDMAGIGEKFSSMYWPALLANWQVWPLIQTINFRFMPLKYRVPFVSLCGVGWTIFLSVLQATRQGGAAEAAVGSGGADGGVEVHS